MATGITGYLTYYWWYQVKEDMEVEHFKKMRRMRMVFIQEISL